METWNERLVRARKAAGLKPVEVALRAGVKQPTYSAWESGEIKSLKAVNQYRVCKALGITEEWLMYGKEPMRRTEARQEAAVSAWEVGTASNIPIRGEVPLISFTQAGNWTEVVDPFQPGVSDHWVKTTARVSMRAYALRIRGDSMEPAISDGAIIIVDPERDPENGQVVVVRQNHDTEATVKRLVVDGGHRYLKPDNPRYPIMQMADDAVFCGVAVQVVKDLV